MTIAIVQGTRPEVIKNYPIVKALNNQNISHVIFHTNQHCETKMRDVIYNEMGYQPDFLLTENYSIGKAIEWLQKQFVKCNIKHVIVNGDTAASVVGSLAALYSDINVSHIEAGLRSRDSFMLEERNRIIVDAIACLLFAYTDQEYKLLTSTPDIRGRVLVEGNTTVDIINDFKNQLNNKPDPGNYIYVTLHRRELTQSSSRMHSTVKALNRISGDICNVVFPIHPRTKNALDEFNLLKKLDTTIQLIEPVSVIKSLQYQKHSAAILTDSGCIQEEAYMLGVPCVTLRENTERHLTIKNGANKLSGFVPQTIARLVAEAIAQPKKQWPNIYGEPGVGRRIVDQISKYLQLEEELTS